MARYHARMEWTREERALYARKELLDTEHEFRGIALRLAPWWGWTVPPHAVASQVNALFDALHDWTLTGTLEDWIDVRLARRDLVQACRIAGNTARVMGVVRRTAYRPHSPPTTSPGS